MTNDNVAFERKVIASIAGVDYYCRYCNFTCRLFTFSFWHFLVENIERQLSKFSLSFQAKVSKLRYDSETDVDKIPSSDYHRSCDSQDS